MKFTMFMLDVVNSLSIFRKVSQDRNISCTCGNEYQQKCLIKLGKFYNDPNCGENWKKWKHNIGKSANVIVLDEKSCQLVWQLCCEIIDRCNDLPAEANLATEILKPSEWKHSEFFKTKSGSCVSPTYHPTEIFNLDIKKIKSKEEICLQLEFKNIVLTEILSEWTFLKLVNVQNRVKFISLQNHGN